MEVCTVAKVVTVDQQPPVWRAWATTAGVGLLVGVIFCILAAILGRYVIEPLSCGGGDAAQCAQAVGLAGNIATVLAAAAGVGLAIRYGLARPLFVGIAAAVFLWGLGDWTAGMFWLEIFGWAVLLYAATYALFAWIASWLNVWLVLGVSLAIVVIERIVLAL